MLASGMERRQASPTFGAETRETDRSSRRRVVNVEDKDTSHFLWKEEVVIYLYEGKSGRWQGIVSLLLPILYFLKQ